jgi:hypothetical protein
MKDTVFGQLIQNYHFFKNGERDASKLEPIDVVHSYLLEAEFIIGAVHFFRLCLRESQPGAIPFVNMESNFLRFLTVEELLVLCETISDQKTKECCELIRQLKDELE